MNFVFISLQPLDAGRESTSTCLARELSRHHRVLYVNPPLDRRTLWLEKKAASNAGSREAVRRKQPELVSMGENFWMLRPSVLLESINWIPFTSIFSRLNRINNRRFAGEIKSASAELGFDKFVLVNDKDIFRGFYLKELLQPEKYIYLHRDNTVAMDYWRRHGQKLEPLLMQKSDAVVCNSPEFTEDTRRYNPRSYNIGNGYDASRYNADEDIPEPEDLSAIPHPRIMYVGALLALRLDVDLMEKLAAARPGWNFVFIGKEDEAFRQSNLHDRPNAYFLGTKHTREVPAYMAHADVCINPQVVNEITDGNFPLKVLEYLAMGKPVVATSTSTMRQVFAGHTDLAAGLGGFVSQIEEALKNGVDKKETAAFLKGFNWQSISNNLLKAIKEPAQVQEAPVVG